jgi:hypothetical protein
MIAEADRARRDTPIRVEELLPPITLAEIADLEGVSPSTVRRRIQLARDDLFGSLTMSGIYYRRRRAKQKRLLQGRFCAARDCDKALPQNASARRQFCHSRCRRREHHHRHQ